MMRKILLLLSLLLPCESWAQTVAVRSGEHDDFTRLVFMFGRPTQWMIEERTGGVDIEFSGTAGRFGLADVFQYIPKTRIKDIRFDEGSKRVKIDLSENVKAEGFDLPSGPLVVDFRIVEVVKPSPRIEKNAAPVDPSILSDLWRQNFQVSNDHSPVGASGDYGHNILAAPNTDQIESDLYRQISRAASQGLLKLDLEESSAGNIATSAPEIPLKEPADQTSSVGMVSNTSIDREMPPAEDTAGSRKAETGCIPANKFALEAYEIEDEHITSFLSAARRNLVEELDRDNGAAAKDLAYAYITLGFGYEAVEVARSFDLVAHDKLAIELMAGVVDQTEEFSLQDVKGCDSSSLMWEFLAGSIDPSQMAMRTKILDSFAKLPRRLRSLLGDRLVQRFIESGYADSAKTVQSNFVHLPQSSEFGSDMARARIAQTDHDAGLAHDILAHEAQKNRQSSIEALTMLVDAANANDEAVEQKLIDQIDALLFELGKTEEAVALVRAKALAQALNGYFSDAMQTLSLGADETEMSDLVAAKDDVLSRAVAHADSFQFAKLYFENADYINQTPHRAELTLGLAEKLAAGGFIEQARAALTKNFRNEPRARELLAEISLREGDAPAALSYLSGLESERAQHISRIARFMLGNDDVSAKDITEEAFADTRLIGLWQHGRWAEIDESGTEAERNFLQKFDVLNGPEAALQEAPMTQPLAEAGALLERSAEERKAFEAFMKEAVPDS